MTTNIKSTLKTLLKVLLILLVLAFVAFQVWLRSSEINNHESDWQALAPMPTPRSEISASVLDEQIYVAGGIGAWGTEDVFERYDVKSNNWETLAKLPQARHHIALATHDKSIYAIGGFSNIQFKASADSWRYDTTKNTWQPIAPMPAPRGEHAAVTVGKFIYVVAGSGKQSQQIWRYSPALNQWQDTGDLMPTARDSAAVVAHQHHIYVIGGRFGHRGGNDMTILERFDTQTGTWELLPPMPTAKAGHAAAIINDTIYTFGGEDLEKAKVHGEVYAYNIKTNTWSKSGYLPQAKHGLAGATVENAIYAIGGGNRSGLRTPFTLTNDTVFWPARSP